MLNELQYAVAVFAHTTVVCTFGLVLALSAAGLSHTPIPLGAGAKTGAPVIAAVPTRRA